MENIPVAEARYKLYLQVQDERAPLVRSTIPTDGTERGMNNTLAGGSASADTAKEKSSYSWDEVRAELDLDEVAVAHHRAQLETEVRAYKLAEVRRRQQVTQQDLARVLGVSQSRVSQIERQGLDDTVLSTLAAYVEALGGRVRVIADFGDELVVLSRVTAGTLADRPADTATRKPRGLVEDLKTQYEAGKSVQALSAETGMSYGLVRQLLSESGATLRSRSAGRKKRNPGAEFGRSPAS
jgi:DNA-binding XRE family transcriptional regulator